MVPNEQTKENAAPRAGRTEIKELTVNPETIQDLSEEEAGKVQGGAHIPLRSIDRYCPHTEYQCPPPN